MKKIFCLFLCITMFAGCKEKIPNPGEAILSSPSDNTACVYVTVSGQVADVNFSWQEADHTDDYRLEVFNVNTSERFSKTTPLLSTQLALPRGEVYRWQVVTTSVLSSKETNSASWVFFLEGESQSHHVPFPAVIESPENDEVITLSNGQWDMQWIGADLDDDISHYILRLGTSAENLQEQAQPLGSNYSLPLVANTSYFWQVETIDEQGNRSNSLIYRFHTAP